MKQSSSKISAKDFIRVGSEYYKVRRGIGVDGKMQKELIPISLPIVKEDVRDTGQRDQIPKYDKFIVLPSHTHYMQEVDSCYNMYAELSHKEVKGQCATILEFLKHIFGEHYEYGLDYFQLLYLQPMEQLPILILVSKERNTGKTTFANFVNDLFQANVTFNTNEIFRSPFNSDWAAKLVIIVDEALLDTKTDYEMIKNKSTAKSIKIELKGVNRREISFYGKFILCSNDENHPVAIEKGETRFWVRKIPSLAVSDPDIAVKLQQEIPAFLYLLSHRKLHVPKKQSRMWFNPADIETEALKHIISYNLNSSEYETFVFLYDLMESYGLCELKFTANSLIQLMKKENIDITPSYLKRILRSWSVPVSNSTYQTLVPGKNGGAFTKSETLKGRFYTVTKQFASEFL